MPANLGGPATAGSYDNIAALLNASDRFWDILRQQISDAQISGPLVTDAALAALAIEHGATLCSTDRDFRRFHGLKLVDPLQPAI